MYLIETAQVELRSRRVEAPAPSPGPASSDAASDQGLTLVHFSAQRKRFLLDRGCI